ncbi:MAG: multidrug transporter MatE, partial [Clostridia bacterium]|nr:multidrug transporter MatE [Clostridia bacterium]
IGLASFLFNVISLMVLLLHFLKNSNSLRWNMYFSGGIFKDVTRFGLIDSSTYLFLALLTLIMNNFISTWFGAEYLILVSVVAVCRELQMVFDGIGEAITPIMSVYVGEENHSGVRYMYSIALKSAVAEGFVVMAAMMLCAPAVPVLLGIEVPELVGYAVSGIRIYALGSVFVSLLYLITSYYLIIEKITLGIIASALRDVIASSLMAVILGMAFGIEGMFAGLAVAPALAYLLLRTVMILRRGKENWPLLLSELPGDAESYLFNLETEPEQIIGLQKDVGNLLTEKGYDRRTVGRAKLLIEELFMLIREKNGDKAILAECSILLRPEGVQVITRDEGILFNISEDDVAVTSIVSLTVSAYMEKLGDNRRYLTTMSFNRSSYVIRTESEQREDS